MRSKIISACVTWVALLSANVVFANPVVTNLIDSKDPNGIEAISNGSRIDKNT